MEPLIAEYRVIAPRLFCNRVVSLPKLTERIGAVRRPVVQRRGLEYAVLFVPFALVVIQALDALRTLLAINPHRLHAVSGLLDARQD